MGKSDPGGRPLSLNAHTEAVRARWAKILGAVEHLSCEDTPVDFGRADASAAFSSIDDLRQQCDDEYLRPLRSIVRGIRAEATPVYPLDEGDAATLSALADRALAGLSAPLEPVRRADGSVTMRRWRGADEIGALTRALKARCL